MTENKATAFFTGASTGVGALQADRLPKRGHDFIPAAILVIALFALLGLSVWFAAYAWTHIGGDPVSDLRLCGHRGRRGVLTCGRRGADGTRLLQQSTRL